MICTCIPHYCPTWRECNGLVLVLPVQWSLWWLLLSIKSGQGHTPTLKLSLMARKCMLDRAITHSSSASKRNYFIWQGYNSHLRTIFSWTGCTPISLDVHCCCRTLNVFPPSAILCMLKSLLDPFIEHSAASYQKISITLIRGITLFSRYPMLY